MSPPPPPPHPFFFFWCSFFFSFSCCHWAATTLITIFTTGCKTPSYLLTPQILESCKVLARGRIELSMGSKVVQSVVMSLGLQWLVQRQYSSVYISSASPLSPDCTVTRSYAFGSSFGHCNPCLVRVKKEYFKK